MKIRIIKDLIDSANHSDYFVGEILEVSKIDNLWYSYRFIQNGEIYKDTITQFYCKEVD